MSTHRGNPEGAGMGPGPEPGPTKRSVLPSGHPEYNVAVTAEEVKPGAWKAVAIVQHAHDESVQATPVSVPDRSFPSLQDAEACALDAAKEWIRENAPRL